MSGMAPDFRDNDEEARHDVEDIIKEEAGSLFSRHARVLVYMNTTALLAGAVWLGIYIQRFSEIERRQSETETRISRITSVERLDAQITALTSEVNRLRDRLDRILDEGVDMRPSSGKNNR